MNFYQGKWLTGHWGTERVSELAEELEKKTKENAEKALGVQFLNYEPWMCAPSSFEFWKNEKPSGLKPDFSIPHIIVDANSLIFLYQVFSSSESQPFGRLDFLDSGLRIEKANSPSLSRFAEEVGRAYGMVSSAQTTFEKRLKDLICHIIPLGPTQPGKAMRKEGSGLSLHHYRGGVLLGLPEPGPFSVAELAINLAHELGHQAAMVYQYADRILESDFAEPVYSAVRKTERPALMSFHALVALAYMYEFLFLFLSQNDKNSLRNYYQQRFQEIRADFELGWQTIRHLRFTELGEGIMREFRDLLDLKFFGA